MNFNNINDIVSGIEKIINIKTPTITPPAPLIVMGGVNRSGLSPIKIASRIIQRKSEAGIPIGNLPSGNESPDEIMIRIIVEEIIKALQEEASISIGIPPGTTVSSAGISPLGPVSTVGSTITFTKGYGVIQ